MLLGSLDRMEGAVEKTRNFEAMLCEVSVIVVPFALTMGAFVHC